VNTYEIECTIIDHDALNEPESSKPFYSMIKARLRGKDITDAISSFKMNFIIKLKDAENTIDYDIKKVELKE
jgi:hypothetical protein